MSFVPSESNGSSKECDSSRNEENDDGGGGENKEPDGLKIGESENVISDLQVQCDLAVKGGVSMESGASTSNVNSSDTVSVKQRKRCYQQSRLAVKRMIQVSKIVFEFASGLEKDLVADESQKNCDVVVKKLKQVLDVGLSKFEYVKKLIDSGEENAQSLCSNQVVVDSDNDDDHLTSSPCADVNSNGSAEVSTATNKTSVSVPKDNPLIDGGRKKLCGAADDSHRDTLLGESINSNKNGDDVGEELSKSSNDDAPDDKILVCDTDSSMCASETDNNVTGKSDVVVCDSVNSSQSDEPLLEGVGFVAAASVNTVEMDNEVKRVVADPCRSLQMISSVADKVSNSDESKVSDREVSQVDAETVEEINTSVLMDDDKLSNVSRESVKSLKRMPSVCDLNNSTDLLADKLDVDSAEADKRAVSSVSCSKIVESSEKCDSDSELGTELSQTSALSLSVDQRPDVVEQLCDISHTAVTEENVDESLSDFSKSTSTKDSQLDAPSTVKIKKPDTSLGKESDDEDYGETYETADDGDDREKAVSHEIGEEMTENDKAKQELKKLLDEDDSNNSGSDSKPYSAGNVRLAEARPKKQSVGRRCKGPKRDSDTERQRTKRIGDCRSKSLKNPRRKNVTMHKKSTEIKSKRTSAIYSSGESSLSSSDVDDEHQTNSAVACLPSMAFADPKLRTQPKVIVERLDVSSFPPFIASKKSKKTTDSSTDSDAEFAKLVSMKGLKKKKMVISDEENQRKKARVESKQKQASSKQRSDPNSTISFSDKGSDDDDTEDVDDIPGVSLNLSDAEEEMVMTKNDLAKRTLIALLESSDDDSSGTEDILPKKPLKKECISDESESELERKLAVLKSKVLSGSDSSSDFVPTFKRKARTRCSILSARISSESDSNASKKRSKKRVLRNTSDDSGKKSDSDWSSHSSSNSRKTKKPNKRRRIRKMMDSSEDLDSDVKVVGEDKVSGSQGETSGSKGRKNIRRVLKDSRLKTETKQAAKEEDERRRRVAQLQKLYNEVCEDGDDSCKTPVTSKLVLAVDSESRNPLLEVHPKLIRKLKPHQVEGVKFMWESTCESMDRIRDHPGSGCILAHCMGLGKTLQVITYIHTLLKNERTGFRTCLVVCPLNTVLNWFNEFKYWLQDTLEDDDEPIEVSELTTVKSAYHRVYALRNWMEDGGVMIMGYEMFRNFANEQAKRIPKSQRTAFQKTLVNPGPDIVICDEGHMLKNSKSALSKAMDRIRTSRRIILTGTPLQNNLAEYHCMVSFVKPSLLGTLKEFQNRFMNPISNGQHADSTASDVKLMKRRAHILHNLLDGCVQRRDYAVLVPYLQPKQEYVISIRLTEQQIKLYSYYMEHFVDKTAHKTLFKDYTVLCRIWTHPWVLRLAQIRAENKIMHDSESSFIDDDTTSEGSSPLIISDDDVKPTTSNGKSKQDSDNDEVINAWKTKTRNGLKEEVTDDVVAEVSANGAAIWWNQFVSEEDATKIELSGKLIILFDILKECESIGDKVLVFSQSLLSLDLLEDMLQCCGKERIGSSWTFGVDYFRLDGSTAPDLRMRYTRIFNNPDDYRSRLFLISTRAGSLGTNLVTANRVVIFDASWNPTHDVQSIFRVYRFGQKKPVYIYRLLAQGTMEEKIYDRQVTKQSLSIRVLDEQQVDRHFTFADLQELYNFEPESVSKRPIPVLPKDRLLADLLLRHKDRIVNYHEHDSLLSNAQEEDLSEDDRKAAWVEYEAERKGLMGGPDMAGIKFDIPRILDDIQQKHPGSSQEELFEKFQATIKLLVEAKKQQQLQLQQQLQQQQQQKEQWRMQMEMMRMQQQQHQQRMINPDSQLHHQMMNPDSQLQHRMMNPDAQLQNRMMNLDSQLRHRMMNPDVQMQQQHRQNIPNPNLGNFAPILANQLLLQRLSNPPQPQQNPSKPKSDDVIVLR